MKTEDAIRHFTNRASIAKALGISRVAVSKWGETVPVESAKALEIRTNGRLRVDWALYQATRKALLERDVDTLPAA
jgi:hypothetical protein